TLCLTPRLLPFPYTTLFRSLLLNQWANVVRWELRPRLFLRTSEFLWQEGHTAHVSEADAHAYAVRILHEVYENFMVQVLAIPIRSEEHTSELQSRVDLVCRL